MNGRPKGSKNKATLVLREAVNGFLEKNFEKVQERFNELDARDQVKFYIDMLQFGLPKLKAVELSSEFERLTDAELNHIIKELTDVANQKKRQDQVFGGS